MINLIEFYERHDRLPFSKRIFDVIVSVLALLVTWPLMILGTAVVLLGDGRPIFHRAERVGVNGSDLVVFKLRTMRISEGPRVTSSQDDRVFRGANTLRQLKLDELPQLVAVLGGAMSVVGPRPEDRTLVEQHYSAEELRTLAVPPGLTSPGTLIYIRDFEPLMDIADPEADYAQNALPSKLRADLEYLQSWTLRADLRLVWRTFSSVVGRQSGTVNQ